MHKMELYLLQDMNFETLLLLLSQSPGNQIKEVEDLSPRILSITSLGKGNSKVQTVPQFVCLKFFHIDT